MFWLGMIVGGFVTLLGIGGMAWLLDELQQRADDRDYETDLRYRTEKWELEQRRKAEKGSTDE